LFCDAKKDILAFSKDPFKNVYVLDNGIRGSAVPREINVDFPWQQRLRERATMLRCTFIAGLVLDYPR
jgi:hypothetical protein